MSRCLTTVLFAGLLVGVAPALKGNATVNDGAANKDRGGVNG